MLRAMPGPLAVRRPCLEYGSFDILGAQGQSTGDLFMMLCNIIKDIRYECDILSPTIRALQRRGMHWRSILHFLMLRMTASGKYGDSPIINVPDGVPLYSRYDLLAYRELFLLDDYRASLWSDELADQTAPIVFDIGANIGMFAALCYRINPAIRLRCFEMIPECASVIRNRLDILEQRDLDVIVCAVMSEGRETVPIVYDSPFAPGNCVHNPDGIHHASVQAISLDSWWSTVSREEYPFLVKIDVEGAEGEVWEGGRQCISRASWVLVELHGHTLNGTFPGLLDTHDVCSSDDKPGNMSVVVLRRKTICGVPHHI